MDTVQWGWGDTMSELGVSLVYRTHWNALPDVAFPPVGRLGLTSPRSTVLCDATTATWPSRGSSLVARSPIPCLLLAVCGLPAGLVAWSKRPAHARAFGHPVPHSGSVTRSQMALPRSRVPPLKTCPALRPRWCPAHAPKRTQDCCLPATGNRRLPTTLPFSGLHHAACLLATPGFVRPLAGRHAGSLLTCWLDFSQVGLEPY